ARPLCSGCRAYPTPVCRRQRLWPPPRPTLGHRPDHWLGHCPSGCSRFLLPAPFSQVGLFWPFVRLLNNMERGAANDMLRDAARNHVGRQGTTCIAVPMRTPAQCRRSVCQRLLSKNSFTSRSASSRVLPYFSWI